MRTKYDYHLADNLNQQTGKRDKPRYLQQSETRFFEDYQIESLVHHIDQSKLDRSQTSLNHHPQISLASGSPQKYIDSLSVKGNNKLAFFSNRLFIDQINHQGIPFKHIGSPNVKMKNLPIIDKRRSVPKMNIN